MRRDISIKTRSKEIRQCQSDDVPQLLEHLKSIYEFNPRLYERDYFDWQFKNIPFGSNDEYTFMILWEAEEIKGFLGYNPIQFYFQGRWEVRNLFHC